MCYDFLEGLIAVGVLLGVVGLIAARRESRR